MTISDCAILVSFNDLACIFQVFSVVTMLEDCAAATQFFCKIIGSDDVLPVKTMLNRIQKAPEPARDYLERKCRDAAELEEFFKDNDHLFFLENKRVALFDEQHETASELSVQFFKTKVQSYGKSVHFYKLKIDNLGNNLFCYKQS